MKIKKSEKTLIGTILPRIALYKAKQAEIEKISLKREKSKKTSPENVKSIDGTSPKNVEKS